MPPFPPDPIFRGDPKDWQNAILSYGTPTETPPVSAKARAIAAAVFYAAAQWNEMFSAPASYQIHAWALLFDSPKFDWLTIDLAERAVHAYFRTAIVGHMLPGHVLNGAAVLALEGACDGPH
ncbi:hypothetical protein [Nocardia tengchongensis]|uniref:hypothetical protein n=1 Tax=Nocardia tengchongensis TaxID=2055889 RepID=UPI003678262C